MAQNIEGVAASADPATKGFVFQQTMFRIKDPKPTLEFYTGVLGMTLIDKYDFPAAKFSLYFLLKLDDASVVPTDAEERRKWLFHQPAALELTHNWGTESDPEFKGYHNGNAEPRGFGHIGFAVPDVYAACERFEKLGVKFIKKPDGGQMKGIAFIQDPDGYWIEILSLNGW
eukprot:Colp12_sorted_trinity150504_noHs@1217